MNVLNWIKFYWIGIDSNRKWLSLNYIENGMDERDTWNELYKQMTWVEKHDMNDMNDKHENNEINEII